MPSIARFFLYCANSSVVKVMESSEWKNISKSKNLKLFRLLKTALELAVEVGNKVKILASFWRKNTKTRNLGLPVSHKAILKLAVNLSNSRIII